VSAEVLTRPLTPSPTPSPTPRRADLKRAAEQALLGVGPIVASLLLLAFQFKIHAVAVDFHSAYYPAAQRLLHGASPYAVTHRQIVAGTAFVYPALSAVAFAPFALLGRSVGQLVYMLVCVACVPATLRTLNVRDWRVYGIALLWLPVYSGWQSANVTLPLVFLVALAWRYRDRPLVAGLITAAAISIKPFVWPLALWLLATRRFRAAAWMLVCGLVFNLLAWAIVGFSEIHTYLRLSGEVTDALWRGGYSMLAVAHHLGFSRGVGEALLLVVSAAVGAGVIYMGFFKHREREALTLAVALMLVASPLVWIHYFVLLLVPLAIMRPRFSAVWTVPLALWVLPAAMVVAGWQLAVAWLAVGACFFALLRPQSGAVERRTSAAAPDAIPKLSASS
jgi:alpha-1,2-mannosyltransferase